MTIQPGQKKWLPAEPFFKTRTERSGLAERAADHRELGVDRCTQRGDGADDNNTDQAGDEAVFNSSGAGFVICKTREQVFHF